MEATNNKGQVVRLFLTAFLSRFWPLLESQIGTLGGKGFEAGIWRELGVGAKMGWLVERNRKKSGRLIANHQYRHHNHLATLPTILAGYGPDRERMDAFHLDLCGQFFNRPVQEFVSVLPLVLKSKGRCLAVTVADARRNIALENWKSFFSRGKKLLGSETATVLFEGLCEQQKSLPASSERPEWVKRLTIKTEPFNPINGAKREFGLLVELAELFACQQQPWLPDAVERYVYISRFGDKGKPFRMRTYFFHFGQQYINSPDIAFVQAWASSKLFYANREPFTEIAIPAVSLTSTDVQRRSMKPTIAPEKTLQGLVEYLGDPWRQEYHDLVAKSVNPEDVVKARKFDVLVAKLDGAGIKIDLGSFDAAPRDSGPKPSRTDNNPPVQNGSRVRLRLDLLKGLVNGQTSPEYIQARDRAIKALRLSRDKARNRKVGGMAATTHGKKFRPQFVREIVKAYEDKPEDRAAVLAEYAPFVSAIDKHQFTVADLLHEAGLDG